MHRCLMISFHMVLIGRKLDVLMLGVLRTSPYSLLMRPLLVICPLLPTVV